MERIIKNAVNLLTLVLIVLLVSCKDQAEPPSVSFKAFTTDSQGNVIKEVNNGGELVITPNQKVYFKYMGSKDDKVSVWPGDKALDANDSTSFNYEAFLNSGGDVQKYHGFALTQGNDKFDFEYNYKAPGNFKAYISGSDVADWGKDIASTQQSISVNVVDSAASFTSFKSFGVKKLGRSIPVTIEYKAEFSGENVTVKVPGSSDVTSVIALFEIEKGSSVKVQNVLQISGLTENNFTDAIVYTITSPNGQSKSYNVRLEKDIMKTEALIYSFEIPSLNVKAAIDQDAKTIRFMLPFATDTTVGYKLAFTKSDLSTVKRSSQVLTSGQTSIRLNKPLKISVLAEDIAFTKVYNLSVFYSVGISSASFSNLNPSPVATFNYNTNTIEIKVLKGTNISATSLNLKSYPINAEMTVVEENGNAVDKPFVSGVTILNLSKPVKIKVSDPDLGEVTYTLSVIILE